MRIPTDNWKREQKERLQESPELEGESRKDKGMKVKKGECDPRCEKHLRGQDA